MKEIDIRSLKGFRGQFIGTGEHWGQLGFDNEGCFLSMGGMILCRIKQGDVLMLGDEEKAYKFKG
jgi:hypothetical protein